MILCSMTPKGCYDWSYELPYVALEASLALDPDYIATAQAHPECYKILLSDSWCITDIRAFKQLIKLAERLGVQEIALPKQCFAECLNYLKQTDMIDKFRWMGVCDGSSKRAFCRSFGKLNRVEELYSIAIPPIRGSQNRVELAAIWDATDKIIHYLGTDKSLKELLDMPKDLFYRVRSCDTRLLVSYALNGKSILESTSDSYSLQNSYPELTKAKYDAVLREYKNYSNIGGR